VTDPEPVDIASGAEYETTTNNCASSEKSVETHSRSRKFLTEVKLTISQAVSTELGGGVPGVAEAKLSAELAASLGIGLGIEEEVTGSRVITTPGNSKSVTRLRWDETWDKGIIKVQRADGLVVGEVPFLALKTLHLTQLESKEISCESGPPPHVDKPPPTDTPTPEQAGPRVIVTGSSVNVRNGPGVCYQVMAQALKNTEHDVIGKTADRSWWKINFEDRPGWIANSVVSIVGPTDAVLVDTAQAICPPPPPPSPPPLYRFDFESGTQCWQIRWLDDVPFGIAGSEKQTDVTCPTCSHPHSFEFQVNLKTAKENKAHLELSTEHGCNLSTPIPATATFTAWVYLADNAPGGLQAEFFVQDTVQHNWAWYSSQTPVALTPGKWTQVKGKWTAGNWTNPVLKIGLEIKPAGKIPDQEFMVRVDDVRIWK